MQVSEGIRGSGTVPLNYLSLVVLHIEERVIMRQFNHLDGMFGGFVNDGQMEQPVWGGQKKRGELK